MYTLKRENFSEKRMFIASPDSYVLAVACLLLQCLPQFKSDVKTVGYLGGAQKALIQGLKAYSVKLNDEVTIQPVVDELGSLSGAVDSVAQDESSLVEKSPIKGVCFKLRDTARIAAHVANLIAAKNITRFNTDIESLGLAVKEVASNYSSTKMFTYADSSLAALMIAGRRGNAFDELAAEDEDLVNTMARISAAWLDQSASLSKKLSWTAVGEMASVIGLASLYSDIRQIHTLIGTDVNPDTAVGLQNRIKGLLRLSHLMNVMAYLPQIVYLNMMVTQLTEHALDIRFWPPTWRWAELLKIVNDELKPMTAFANGIAETALIHYKEVMGGFELVGIIEDLVPANFIPTLGEGRTPTKPDEVLTPLDSLESIIDDIAALAPSEKAVMATATIRSALSSIPAAFSPLSAQYAMMAGHADTMVTQLDLLARLLKSRLIITAPDNKFKQDDVTISLTKLAPHVRRTFIKEPALYTDPDIAKALDGFRIIQANSAFMSSLNNALTGAASYVLNREEVLSKAGVKAVKELESGTKQLTNEILTPAYAYPLASMRWDTCYDVAAADEANAIYRFVDGDSMFMPGQLTLSPSRSYMVEDFDNKIQTWIDLATGQNLPAFTYALLNPVSRAAIASALSGAGVLVATKKGLNIKQASPQGISAGSFHVIEGYGKPYGLAYASLLALTRLYRVDDDSHGKLIFDVAGLFRAGGRRPKPITDLQMEGETHELYFLSFVRIPQPSKELAYDVARGVQRFGYFKGDLMNTVPVSHFAPGRAGLHAALRPRTSNFRFPSVVFTKEVIYFNEYEAMMERSRALDSYIIRSSESRKSILEVERWEGQRSTIEENITPFARIITKTRTTESTTSLMTGMMASVASLPIEGARAAVSDDIAAKKRVLDETAEAEKIDVTIGNVVEKMGAAPDTTVAEEMNDSSGKAKSKESEVEAK